MPGVKPSVRWARFGELSKLAAKARPMSEPPVLVVSTPRSGSSWLGDGLAVSPSVAYLREPLSEANSRVYRGAQTELLERPGKGSPTFEFDPNDPPPAYRHALEFAALGVPAFGHEVVADRDRWSFTKRSDARLVVKEVNPFAIEWLLRELDWQRRLHRAPPRRGGRQPRRARLDERPVGRQLARRTLRVDRSTHLTLGGNGCD